MLLVFRTFSYHGLPLTPSTFVSFPVLLYVHNNADLRIKVLLKKPSFRLVLVVGERPQILTCPHTTNSYCYVQVYIHPISPLLISGGKTPQRHILGVGLTLLANAKRVVSLHLLIIAALQNASHIQQSGARKLVYTSFHSLLMDRAEVTYTHVIADTRQIYSASP